MRTPEGPELEFNPMIIAVEELDFTKVSEIDKTATMAFCIELIGIFNHHVRFNEHKAARHLYEVVNLMTGIGEKRDSVFGQRQLAHLMHRKLSFLSINPSNMRRVIVRKKTDPKDPNKAVYTILNRNDSAAI